MYITARLNSLTVWSWTVKTLKLNTLNAQLNTYYYCSLKLCWLQWINIPLNRLSAKGGYSAIPPSLSLSGGWVQGRGAKFPHPWFFSLESFKAKLKCEKCSISPEGVFNLSGTSVQFDRTHCLDQVGIYTCYIWVFTYQNRCSSTSGYWMQTYATFFWVDGIPGT